MAAQPQSYWDAQCTPEEIATLTKQEREFRALGRLGYKGHLNDRRRNFYFDRTGIDFLVDARNENDPNQL
ncbi:hypothetical protein ACFRCQ_07540 [Cytobacillus firmus]|uniref:hypothetical protein n=1 Tax=Cytobacillus firmus TaxID=1399 RepID=UPI00369C73D2